MSFQPYICTKYNVYTCSAYCYVKYLLWLQIGSDQLGGLSKCYHSYCFVEWCKSFNKRGYFIVKICFWNLMLIANVLWIVTVFWSLYSSTCTAGWIRPLSHHCVHIKETRKLTLNLFLLMLSPLIYLIQNKMLSQLNAKNNSSA